MTTDDIGRFAGKRALITGGARGQGRSFAVALAREGCDVAILDIASGSVEHPPIGVATRADLDEAARLIEDTGRKCVPLVCDVSKDAEVQEAVGVAVAELGGLDFVVANAGVEDRFAESWKIPTEDWLALIGVNLTGVWLTCKYTIPHLIESGAGSAIVLTSSLAGLRANPYNSNYTAAKHGVLGLGRCLANELGQFRIRCNILHPGSIDTPMVDDLVATNGMTRADLSDQLKVADPFGAGLVPPEDSTTPAVLWLLSDEAKYINGMSMVVDSGAMVKVA